MFDEVWWRRAVALGGPADDVVDGVDASGRSALPCGCALTMTQRVHVQEHGELAAGRLRERKCSIDEGTEQTEVALPEFSKASSHLAMTEIAFSSLRLNCWEVIG